MILRSSFWIVSDLQVMITRIAWHAVLIAVFCLVIWGLIKKPISRFLRIKKAYVQIIHVQRYGPQDYKAGDKSRTRRLYSFSNTTVAVRFIDPKRRGRKVFYMNLDGVNEGQKGELQYQGVYGLSFLPEATETKESYYQKYNFARKKKEDRAVAPENRTHHKRKYW